ncbi:hypothetical protein HPP92_022007 [Vanilla planifolia]|uniref:Anaphase-promoting complex subunit 2 TPR repeats domain-containing protein n=1 Tax=Vanilla planifolia TaxID=51239 RepID=A0A835UI73_VANPL|nr:hypothetical protein HPP92_022007 [Vanilla planifolia]
MLQGSTMLDFVTEESVVEILRCWTSFVSCTEKLICALEDISAASEFSRSVALLCRHGLSSVVEDHFLQYLEDTFMRKAVIKFWQQFEKYNFVQTSDFNDRNLIDQLQEILSKSLEDICFEKNYQEKCLLILVQAHHLYKDDITKGKPMIGMFESKLYSRYHMMVASVLLMTLPSHFSEVLRLYFKHQLDELNTMMVAKCNDGWACLRDSRDLNCNVPDEMSIDGMHPESSVSKENSLVKSIGRIVHDLRNLGFVALTEDAYASSIFQLLKAKVQSLAVDDYRTPVLQSIKDWILAVPLQFLHALLQYLGEPYDSSVSSSLKSPLALNPLSYPGLDAPCEGLVRWKLRLEYFTYETLQDLRIGKLFEIIVDYPDSSPAIEDLKQCLEYTGQHSKLVDSFISSLRYRLLTAGAATNDILHQYVSPSRHLER